jgi:hypothetical protein
MMTGCANVVLKKLKKAEDVIKIILQALNVARTEELVSMIERMRKYNFTTGNGICRFWMSLTCFKVYDKNSRN